eukprot:365289-Chlamydomonas_euryale.AAC.4
MARSRPQASLPSISAHKRRKAPTSSSSSFWSRIAASTAAAATLPSSTAPVPARLGAALTPSAASLRLSLLSLPLGRIGSKASSSM